MKTKITKKYYLQFVRPAKDKDNEPFLFVLVTVVFNNYKRAKLKFNELCKNYPKETILFSYSDGEIAANIAIRYKSQVKK